MHVLDIIRIYAEDSYHGSHRAPGKEPGTSMDNCTPNIWPEDFYSNKAVQYYGSGYPEDAEAIRIIQSARNKPGFRVKIYRTVPKYITNQDKVNKYIKEKAYILKTGKLPQHADRSDLNKSEYYDWIDEEITRIQALNEAAVGRVGINPGDWVTITRRYAVDHGEAHLDGQHRLITKTVPAGTLYTDGNSVQEWGYNP
jgi:hypothetical protein